MKENKVNTKNVSKTNYYKKNKKIFRDYPEQCKQNKRIAGNIHSTQTRKKERAKHN